ncbi:MULTISPECIES: hypothetical protein [unclassified Aurantimonas]|uniref:hypothetical protein n=1 Tax=unclassified Aurantimonas TaxID=2638230 RepID=UPI002E17EB7D|nr:MULTISPECIES: hypothetical protein [unclassified Aurantimonas]MEC5289419.1 hypothetical protein [Aurantimonas sp. C2-3-R2]MEC5410499.1 hypothetical protein [Aurantimonas sp. C2-4-R8]
MRPRHEHQNPTRRPVIGGALIQIIGDLLSADGETGEVVPPTVTASPVAHPELGQYGVHCLADRHPVLIALVIHAQTFAHG